MIIDNLLNNNYNVKTNNIIYLIIKILLKKKPNN